MPLIRMENRTLVFVALWLASACAANAAFDADTFTLYRSSVLNSSMRIHVATFDSDEGADYNRENCNLAADLMQHQDGVKTRFWCEPGRFRR